MLSGLANQGQQAATTMGNFGMAGANAIANQNSNAAQSGSAASNNYANNTGSLAIAQGQNNANMYTNIGNAVTGVATNPNVQSLANKYLGNNTGLSGSGGGGGGSSSSDVAM